MLTVHCHMLCDNEVSTWNNVISLRNGSSQYTSAEMS